jgi:hypothetical protein
MSLLLFRGAMTKPATRPRAWFQLLFKLYEPRKGRLSEGEAAAVIARNWHRSYADLKSEGVE